MPCPASPPLGTPLPLSIEFGAGGPPTAPVNGIGVDGPDEPEEAGQKATDAFGDGDVRDVDTGHNTSGQNLFDAFAPRVRLVPLRSQPA
ncbi:hypothetical protein [Streptomyces sp. YKOK-I1]